MKSVTIMLEISATISKGKYLPEQDYKLHPAVAHCSYEMSLWLMKAAEQQSGTITALVQRLTKLMYEERLHEFTIPSIHEQEGGTW